MELWFVIVVSLCLAGLIKSLLGLLSSPSSAGPKLPPGPLTFPLIGNFLWLRKSFAELEPILRYLHSKHGPMVTLRLGPRPAVFVSSRSLAHQALVQNGAAFADRPPALPIIKILSSDQHNISSAFYGPTWRVLRRNLTAEILHPARVRSYSRARRWVLDILLDRLRAAGPKTAVRAVDHFQYAMFCLLVLMCFGDRLEERQIREWEEFHQLRRNKENVLLPLIRARSEARGKFKADNIDKDKDHAEHVMSYVDTLLNLELPPEEGKRKLTEAEMLGLCSEFLNAGTDTTSTTLQWIMANIVKYPEVQETLYSEIRAVVGTKAATVEEEDLQRMPYLKAVVLEGLRRHPPGHFVLSHSVTEDIELGGYLVPKKGTVNFMVAEMGWDSTVWEDPMAFKPERFFSNSFGSNEGAKGFDITGSKEIKMMPFGVGRRMCPGFALALLHLEYFVANLVWAFEWRAMEGDDVDLSEKQEFTMVMKNPLQAIVSPRLK
ncbi:hypothetical protein CDL15_Pgr018524 [Punica granatum]|uniref:Cytochrome P450 89A2-like n=1 Tax=Punica granatum TaxID=22663 RepID=A0A218WYJ5_PUNGR|nr:hypothetical protein CDL15_Pgr018524 [Punica granatum]